MAELATGNTGTKAVVANTNGIILELIGEVILALGHGSNEDADTLLLTKSLDVVLDTHNLSLVTERDLSAIWWKVIRDWVLDDL